MMFIVFQNPMDLHDTAFMQPHVLSSSGVGMPILKLLLAVGAFLGLTPGGPLSGQAATVAIEAESGVLGANWMVTNNPSPISITVTNTTTGSSPGTAARVASYTINFPAADVYNLYARVLVGPGAFTSDSLYYGNGFGTQAPATAANWIMINGLASAGFTNTTEVVTGGGAAGTLAWKWVNLSQYNQSGSGSSTPATFTVPAGSLTQTLQIGGREAGLLIDKLVFGSVSNTFTVANLDNGTDGTPPPPPTATIDTTKSYQTIEGLGGATAFYAGWITAHPYQQEIYTNAFAGLNLSMLRLGDWYRYQTPLTGFDSAATLIVSNANRVLGHPVPVYMSSWAPPAFLKSNGQVGNGGTLVFTNGSFAYTNFAQYWLDSINAYRSNGVNLTWASIQNEPDWVAGYDSCILNPNEGAVNGTNYASYSKALDAVAQSLASLPAPPKLLAPEPVHISYGDLTGYGATLHSNSFYGVAHHLYGDGGATGDSFLAALSAAATIFPGKPHFMTEYGDVKDMIECANLIHNELVVEQVSGYNHWSLVWPGTNGGLIQIENPYAAQSTWTNAPPGTPTQAHGWWYSPSYWSMKHFSYFIQPGYKRVGVTANDNNVRASAYLSPDGLRTVVVLINTNAAVTAAMNFNFGGFGPVQSRVYQTANTNYFFASLGALTNAQALPPRSLTTVVADKILTVGAASNPGPASGTAAVTFNTPVTWAPGSNALLHAVYFGGNSNAVAQATLGSPQFIGLLATNLIYPALAGGTNYYWRVDEIAGANTNPGPVWNFATAPVPWLLHDYGFSETVGTNTVDAVGGPAWSGGLPNGGTWSNGQLTLSANSQQYVSLPTGLVATLTNFTILAWTRLTSASNWARLFDFGNNPTTNMYLVPQNGSNGKIRFAITTSGSGGEQQINGNVALTTGTWHQVAVVLSVRTGVLYVDGLPVGTNSAMTLNPLLLGSTSNNYLGKSQYADPYLNGVLDEFRIYSQPLAAAEVAATYALGPSQMLNTNNPSLSAAAQATNLTLFWPLASAGFTLQSSTNLGLGKWLNITAPAPQIVGGQWQSILPLNPNNPPIFYRLVK